MPVRTISTKLAVEGEAQYRQSISACNSELKTLKSDLQLVESEFRNNANSIDALTKKNDALGSIFQKQEEKISTLEKALKNAQDAYEKYASRVSTAQSNIERYEQALESLKNSTGDTAEEQEALTKELDKWNAELEEAQAGQAAAEKGIQNWQKQLNEAKIDLNNLSDTIDQNSQYLREAEQSADGCAKSIDEFGKEVKDAGEDSKEFGDTSKDAINQLAAALAVAGIASSVKEIADALLDCVNTFAEFESQMSTVKAISGASGEEFTALAEKAKYMGATTAFTATEAAQALEYMAMAGWETGDMLDGLEGVMYLAAASGEDLASTSDIVTDALTAFGLAASDSTHFADVLAAASSSANTNVGMMGETFKYVAPVAGALGYSIEDTSVAIGLMANAGIKSTQAGTALRSILTRLASNAGATKTQMGALEILTKNLGVEFYNLDGSTRDLNDVLEESRAAWAGLSEEEQISYGKIIAGQEAMSGWLALMNAGEGDVQKLSAAINTCGNAAKEMSEIKLDNLSGQMTLLESASDGLKLAIGEQLAPVLTKLAEAGTGAFAWATDFVNDNPWIVGAVAGLTAALGALAVGVTALSAAPAIIGALSTALNLLMANPIIGVTAALAGLAVAIGTWAASLDDADEKTKGFTDSLQDSKTAYEDLTTTMASQQASTKAVADSLLDLLEVEEKSALQKDLIAEKVAQLNEAIPELGLYYDREKDSLIGLTEAELESMVARAAAQEEYEAQVARINELSTERAEIEARLTEARLALNEAQETGSGNTRELKNNINELTAAQEENAAQIAALEEASSAFAEQQREAALKTETMTAKIEGLQAEMEALEQSYRESYEAAYESISSQVSLFKDLEMSADTSISDMIDSMRGQVEYMETYAANIQKAMEMGVDLGLVQKLSDGSKESAQILDTIVKGGEEDIKALNEEFAKVEEGKNRFSATVADMETDFERKMTELSQDLGNAMKEMNRQEEAYQIGQNNIAGLINGTASQRTALINQYAQMGRDALAAYKREVGQASPSKKFHEVGRYDIKGIIGGVEEEKQNFIAEYESLAQMALSSMERHLPSVVEAPAPSLELSRQTAAIVDAVSNREGWGSPIQIHVDKLEVRNDSDIQRVAQELYYLTEQKRRSRGGGVL